jgi:hypothetical protein
MEKVRLSMLFTGQIYPRKSPQHLLKRFDATIKIGFKMEMIWTNFERPRGR